LKTRALDSDILDNVAVFRIVANGRTTTVQADPDTPLLWVLRDELRLTGTKFGCGIAQCGACTVFMNGSPIRSCVTPISAVGKSKIVTVEALSRNPVGARVQRAWVAEDVPQCGYCQSGMVMEATALLSRAPKPSDAQIDDAMSGHICRCGTYVRIRRAIKRAATHADDSV
jgi:isoquinoline 1-oxidoreductase alpha subunit